MGYDYPECISCYCNDNLNEDSDNIYNICDDCLSSYISLTNRARMYAESVFRDKLLCVKCKKQKEGYDGIPFCNNHFKHFIEN